jgi:hypothetical protein
MLRRPDGQVSLLVHFLPREVRDAARGLTDLLSDVGGVVMTLDARRGQLELTHVRGGVLGLLTDWLRRRGARGVFVRYDHEGWLGAPAMAMSAPAPLN